MPEDIEENPVISPEQHQLSDESMAQQAEHAQLKIEIGAGRTLLLGPEEASHMEEAIEVKNNTVRQNTERLLGLSGFIEDLDDDWQVGEGHLTLSLASSVPAGWRSALPRLKERQAEYADTKKGQEDARKRQLRLFVAGSAELSAQDRHDIAVSLGHHPKRSEKLFKSKAESRIAEAQSTARQRLKHEASHTNGAFEIDNVIWQKLDGGADKIKAVDPNNRRPGTSMNKSQEELVQMMEEATAIKDKTAQDIAQALEAGEFDRLFSDVTAGLTSWEAIEQEIMDRYAPSSQRSVGNDVHFGAAIGEMLQAREVQLMNDYPEISLAGLRYGDQERATLGEFLSAANEVRGTVGLKTTSDAWLQTLEQSVAKAQAALADRIDSDQTQYWHFTPVIRKALASKSLKARDEEGVSTTTNDYPQNQSVHFIKPGNWPGHNVVTDRYINYAHRTITTRGDKISNALGAAVVLTLDDLADTYPTRNEGRDTGAPHQHVSTDAVFRDAEEVVARSIDIEKAFIVPAFSSDQASWEETVEVDAATGEAKRGPDGLPIRRSPVREALVEAGYSQEWIDLHLVDPRVAGGDTYDHMAAAQKEIARRIQQQRGASKHVYVPLRAARRALETLDGKGLLGTNEPALEKLIKVTVA